MKKKTLAFVYFNDFKENVNYCVNVKALKLHDVMELQPAGVKVYDYDFKRKKSDKLIENLKRK